MIKKFLDTYKWDVLTGLFFLFFSVSIWWPSHYYPLFWDSTFLVHQTQSIIKSNFTNLVNPDPGYAQPTFVGVLLAICWKFFGTSVTVSHALMFPFLPILLISAYFFISKRTNNTLGFLSATLIGFTPVVLAEYVNVYVDLPTAAFVALSLLMWQRKKYPLWALFFTFAILTKLPSLAIAPYFFFQSLYLGKKKIIISLLLPLIVVSTWLAYHYSLTGWLLSSPNIQLAITQESFNPIPQILNVLYLIFLGQGRLYISIPVLGLLLYMIAIRRPSLKNILNLKQYYDLIPIVSAAIFFVSAGEFGYRYAIFIYIFYADIIASIIFKFTQAVKNSNTYVYVLFIIALIAITTFWHPKEGPLQTTRFEAPDDLGIIDYIYVFRSVAAYAQLHRAENFVYYGAFPENVGFTDPTFGFVKEPVPFTSCEKFVFNPNQKQIIIIHPFSPSQLPCVQITRNQPSTIMSGSEQNGKWVDLYLIDPKPSTPSAQKV